MKRSLALYAMILTLSAFILAVTLLIVNSNATEISQNPLTARASRETSDNSSENDENLQAAAEKKDEPKAEVPTERVASDKKTSITFNFMGDCTLGTYCGEDTEYRFNWTAERVEPEYFFEGVQSILDKGTFNITNCEGVLTDNPLEEVYKGYEPAFWFKSPSKNANIFKVAGIDVCGIANNHIDDYGEEGRQDTIDALTQYGIEWSDITKPVVLEHEGIKIALFCFCMWDDGMPERIIKELKEYNDKTDIQIMFYHGGTEKVHEPDAYKYDYTHQFVDAGADLVVGSHPHVLQPIDVYKDVTILHSLGNFVYGGNTAPENRTIVYTHTFELEGTKISKESEEIHPCYIYTGDMNAFQPTLITDETDKQAVLDFMYGKSSSPFYTADYGGSYDDYSYDYQDDSETYDDDYSYDEYSYDEQTY